MAVTFPTSPTNGQQITAGGKTYTYSSATGTWNFTADNTVLYSRQEFVATADQTTFNITYSTSYPIEVFVNGLQYLSTDYTATNGTTVVLDTGVPAGSEVVINYATVAGDPIPTDISDLTDTSSLLGAGGATVYANLAAFPSSGNSAGDLAFATDTKALYVWDGAEWDRVYSDVQEGISWVTQPDDTYTVEPGATQAIAIEATDPDGFPIDYTYTTNDANSIISSVTGTQTGFDVTIDAAAAAGTTASFRSVADNGLFKLYKTSTILSAAESASQLAAAGISTDGVYNLYLDGSGSAPTECYVNFSLPGGPYILAMVVASGGAGDAYGYDGTVWTDTTGGATTALNPTSNTNQVHSTFYTLATTRTALALGTNASTHMHYYSHASYTARALANGAIAVPTAKSTDSSAIAAGDELFDSSAGIASGWTRAFEETDGNAWVVGGLYMRYGYQHGTPEPAQYGYIRFGHTADVDASDSRDRMLGIGIKNGGGGPLGSNVAGAGGLNYVTSSVGRIARTQGWLYLKN